MLGIMRLTMLLPLAYLAGVHGFAMFAPYLAVFLAAAHLLRRRRLQPAPIPIRPLQVATIFSFQK